MPDVIDAILDREGWPVFTERAHDRGGPTKGGITLATYTGYLGRQATIDELKALDRPTARQVYELLFIIRPGFVHIEDARVRDYLIDIGVTSEPARAARYLQGVLGFTGKAVDGICGSSTVAAANALDGGALLCHLIARRSVMLASFVQDHPDQLENLEGWISRSVEPLTLVPLKPKEAT